MQELYGRMLAIIRRTDILVIAGVVLLVAAYAFYQHRTSTPQYTLGMRENQAHLHELFRNEIQTYGGKGAYARLGAAMQTIPEAIQHEYAHQFGGELYKLEGEAGMEACDPQFHFGCFHQFLSMSIADNGIEAVNRLYRQCGEIMGQTEICQHGLGHGILAMYGYTQKDLLQALDVCDPIQGDEPITRCDGGVFMEYNVRTIQNVEGVPGIREVKGGNYLEPCKAIPEKYRYSCLYWLPQWWFASEPAVQREPETRTSNAIFKRMGERCAMAEFQRPCYEGIGYIMITASGFNPDVAREICDSLGTKHRGNLYCRSMAGAVFSGAESLSASAPHLCDGLNEADTQYCLGHVYHDGAMRAHVVPPEPIE